MSQKIQILHRTLWVLGTAFALTLGMSSIASAQTPVWDNEYVGSVHSKFKVKSCGHEQNSGEAVVNLWGPGNEGNTCFGVPCGEGTWAINVPNSGNVRLAGIVHNTSGNGKKLYLRFFEHTRKYLEGSFFDAKGELCQITPLPDQVVFTQAVIKTNKLGSKAQTKIRAKYGAVVNIGGALKQAQFRFNSTATAIY